ncbi:hypothetical protein N658DRAFT_568434 [Parathielavia hyrcaniae]|uniref:Zn(2)-C6 fungal-type domain-containing protein n=1 Tax=Parathielavia hyrcaniae TaxID=113614 RepID=A0AAN6PW25_9PEZI|nr:hypothetical protein N658DRAFT_568434 [Parathielavia hyrcaniae]
MAMTSFHSRTRRPHKSCIQCAKAKRKCDKTSPSCLRCREREVRCEYLSRLIPRGGSDTPELEQDNSDRASSTTSMLLDTRTSPTHGPSASLGSTASEPLHAIITDVTENTLNSRWFLSPESWIHQHSWMMPQYYNLPVSEKSLSNFTTKLKRWVDDWVRDEHSPIMHRLTYEDYTPECVEDAYTSLAAYNAASPGAKQTALRVMDSRVNKLLMSQTHDEDVDGISSAFLLDTPAHLARTQALFIYQLVRLFDGDIRARAQAESHMETLDRWAGQMVESAQLDCTAAAMVTSTVHNGNMTTTTEALAATSVDEMGLSIPVTLQATPTASPSSTNNNLNPTFQALNHDSPSTTAAIPPTTNMTTTTPPPMTNNMNPFSLPPGPCPPPPPLLHKAWLLSESIRRIYVASITLRAVYTTLRQGWSNCPGAMAYTAQSGLWDARECYAWARVLWRGGGGGSGGGGGGGGGEQGQGQGGGAVPGEVDEFAVAVAEIYCGVERVERWVFEKGG